MTDGGYYAIKGFDYQIDKTVVEILNCADDSKQISIEQIQDINADNFVMQVKYKETQKYIVSKIKEPLTQLIDEFINCIEDENKIYYLYCYFLDRNAEELTLSLGDLDHILGNKKGNYSVAHKEQFVSRFALVFSPDFQTQFENVIAQIKTTFSCTSIEEAIVHYSTIVHSLRLLVVSNDDPQKRFCTKMQLVAAVRNNRAAVFESGLKYFMDEQQRLKLVKSRLPTLKRNQNNFIFFGDIEYGTTTSLAKIISDLLEAYYRKASKDLKPLTIIVNDPHIDGLKTSLIDSGIVYNDGYEDRHFSYPIFSDNPVTNTKAGRNGKATESLGKISFRLRLISFSTYAAITEHTLKSDMAYVFNLEDARLPQGVPFISIDCLNAESINALLR